MRRQNGSIASNKGATMGKHLVLVGGGHAHMVTLANLGEFTKRGHRVTVIGPSDYHYYSGMGPGMLGLNYKPEEIRFATRRVVEKHGGIFVRAKVTRIDPDRKAVVCDDGTTCRYDILSFNAGSYVPDTVVEGKRHRTYSVKPIEHLMDARQEIVRMAEEKPVTVGVVGGGAAAVEVAGNVWSLLSRTNRHGFKVGLYTQGGILTRFPKRVRTAARNAMQQRSIGVSENTSVKRVCDQTIELTSGSSIETDFVFLATGVRPSRIFSVSGLPTGPDGGLLVNPYLQNTAYPDIFGGGDCIYFRDRPLDKVGVYAVRQNPVLFQNLMASLESKPLTAFDPGGAYLLIFNMGDRTGLLYKSGLMLGGRLAFTIKDAIDRRFMRKFQSIE
jgi:NADH dehydrogenase FAD-containing subunit